MKAVITRLSAELRLINFFKPILFMASDSSSGFRQVYHTFLYGHIKYNGEGGRKRTNEQTRTWVHSKRKKGCFVTLCIFHASVDYRRRVFCAKLRQKPRGMPTHLWLSSLTISFCWPSFPRTAISRRLVSSALRCRLPLSVFLCQLTLSLLWYLPLFVHFQSCGGFRAEAPCLGFAPKQTKRSSARRTHIYPTQWPHSVTRQ